MIGIESPAGRVDSPLHEARRSHPLLAMIAGIGGVPTAIWFNHAVMPTDGPGPGPIGIGIGTVIIIHMLLCPDARGRS